MLLSQFGIIILGLIVETAIKFGRDIKGFVVTHENTTVIQDIIPDEL